MPTLINEIEWSEPILPVVEDTEWRKQVKHELGGESPDLMMIVSPSEWLRIVCLKWPRYLPQEFSLRLADIATLVCAQENACRYCYGIAKAQLKLFGYSEKLVSKIEMGVHLAELDEKELTFIQFCRNLARSSPRPQPMPERNSPWRRRSIPRLRRPPNRHRRQPPNRHQLRRSCFRESRRPQRRIRTVQSRWSRRARKH